ncbi:hypothetical protein GF373_00730, partial [bacterium]|nr:hypothetical protein [bacterium]
MRVQKPYQIAWLCFGVLFLLIFPSQTQGQPQAEAIWRRIVEANRPWLMPQNPELSYEIHSQHIFPQVRKHLYKVWYKGPAQARLERYDSRGTLGFTIVFTDGIRALPDSEQNYYTFSPNVPLELGIGINLSLSIMRAARQG